MTNTRVVADTPQAIKFMIHYSVLFSETNTRLTNYGVPFQSKICDTFLSYLMLRSHSYCSFQKTISNFATLSRS